MVDVCQCVDPITVVRKTEPEENQKTNAVELHRGVDCECFTSVVDICAGRRFGLGFV